MKLNFQVRISRTHAELFRNIAERRGTSHTALLESMIDREVMFEIQQQEMRGERTMDRKFEQIARTRVEETPELKAIESTIFYDWPNWDEHMEWIATASVAEIVDWAETVEKE